MENRRDISQKGLAGVSFFSTAVYGILLSILSPLLPSISDTFSLSLSQTGTIFTINFFGFVTFTFLSGFFADKYGKKKILSIDLLGMVISLCLLGISSQFSLVLICMFFIGGFSGVLEGIFSAVLVEANPLKEAFYVNACQIFFGIGAMVGPVTAAFWVANGLPWRWCYFVLSALFLICLMFLIFTNTNKRQSASQSISIKAVKKIISNRKMQLLCLCMFCYSGAEAGSWGWLSTFLTTESGFSIEYSGVAISLFWGVVVAGRIGCLGALKKHNERNIVIILALLTAIGIILTSFLNNLLWLWVGIVIMGLGYSAQWPLIVAHGTKDWPEYSGTAATLLIGSCGVGMMVIPMLIGVIGEVFSMRWAMTIPSLLMMVIALIFIYLITRDKREKGIHG